MGWVYELWELGTEKYRRREVVGSWLLKWKEGARGVMSGLGVGEDLVRRQCSLLATVTDRCVRAVRVGMRYVTCVVRELRQRCVSYGV